TNGNITLPGVTNMLPVVMTISTSSNYEYNIPNKYTFELMDAVPPTPHDSPLTGGYILGSDERRLKLKELMAMCIKLSKQVLDLEEEKDA
ncbi:hypothetical protein Tco_0427268, partial [Tanacetum coccineum]